MTQTSAYEVDSVTVVTNGTGAVPPGPAPHHPNPAPVPAGPQARKRVEWFELPADSDYPGFRFRAWVNFSNRVNEEIRSGEQDRAAAALNKVVLETNDWLDEEGEPYPPAHDPDFWQAIPTDLASAMMVMIEQSRGKLPRSLMTSSAR